MKRFNIILILFALSLFSNHASAQGSHKHDINEATVKTEKVMLCGKCGQIKGTEQCCKADAETCSKCGLHKGSPGCCKIKK